MKSAPHATKIELAMQAERPFYPMISAKEPGHRSPLGPPAPSNREAAHGIERVVSGGQSGVDRAALDVALELALATGGWCPRGRRAEDGRISDRYPLTETPAEDDRQCTDGNVRDSDANLMFAAGRPTGGTALTDPKLCRLARQSNRDAGRSRVSATSRVRVASAPGRPVPATVEARPVAPPPSVIPRSAPQWSPARSPGFPWRASTAPRHCPAPPRPSRRSAPAGANRRP